MSTVASRCMSLAWRAICSQYANRCSTAPRGIRYGSRSNWLSGDAGALVSSEFIGKLVFRHETVIRFDEPVIFDVGRSILTALAHATGRHRHRLDTPGRRQCGPNVRAVGLCDCRHDVNRRPQIARQTQEKRCRIGDGYQDEIVRIAVTERATVRTIRCWSFQAHSTHLL